MDHETYESTKNVLTSVVRSYLKAGDQYSPAEIARDADDLVSTFERLAVQRNVATGGMPETPKLAPGDELLVVQNKTRYRPQFVQAAEVTNMARFRVCLTWVSLETGRRASEDFDVRSRQPWVANKSADRIHAASSVSFFTADQWAWELRARLADDYLKERGVYPSSVRGSLSGLLSQDRVGFANALRRLEGLVEL